MTVSFELGFELTARAPERPAGIDGGGEKVHGKHGRVGCTRLHGFSGLPIRSGPSSCRAPRAEPEAGIRGPPESLDKGSIARCVGIHHGSRAGG